jgi:hypothetical protein
LWQNQRPDPVFLGLSQLDWREQKCRKHRKKLWGQALQLTSTAQFDIALRAVMELKYKLRKLSEQNNPNQGKSYGARPYI